MSCALVKPSNVGLMILVGSLFVLLPPNVYAQEHRQASEPPVRGKLFFENITNTPELIKGTPSATSAGRVSVTVFSEDPGPLKAAFLATKDYVTQGQEHDATFVRAADLDNDPNTVRLLFYAKGGKTKESIINNPNNLQLIYDTVLSGLNDAYLKGQSVK